MPEVYPTGEAAYAAREAAWGERTRRERREAERRSAEGQGATRPLSAVPEIDRYLFDCQGYLVIRRAVGKEQLAEWNAQLDADSAEPPGKAFGISAAEAGAMMENPHSPDLKDLQQGFGEQQLALGTHPCFDSAIDHPGWISHIRDFVSQDDTVLSGGGGVTYRWPGQASGVHGGGPSNPQFGWVEGAEEGDEGWSGRFECQLVSVLLALNDAPAGGGGCTMVIPVRSPPALCISTRLSHPEPLTQVSCAAQGSHKSNLRHPFQLAGRGHPQALWRCTEPFQRRHDRTVAEGGFMDGMPGAVELGMEAGDALVLAEACVHGSGMRTLPGCRRTMIIRYAPSAAGAWKAPAEVLQRLSGEARALVSAEPATPEDAAPYLAARHKL